MWLDFTLLDLCCFWLTLASCFLIGHFSPGWAILVSIEVSEVTHRISLYWLLYLKRRLKFKILTDKLTVYVCVSQCKLCKCTAGPREGMALIWGGGRWEIKDIWTSLTRIASGESIWGSRWKKSRFLKNQWSWKIWKKLLIHKHLL